MPARPAIVARSQELEPSLGFFADGPIDPHPIEAHARHAVGDAAERLHGGQPNMHVLVENVARQDVDTVSRRPSCRAEMKSPHPIREPRFH